MLIDYIMSKVWLLPINLPGDYSTIDINVVWQIGDVLCSEQNPTLWQRNQWKRERYAPSFHIDEYSLDPKSWARFPILSGNYSND